MSWKLHRSADGSTLVVTFRGRLGAADGATSAAALVEELLRAPAYVVWDVVHLIRYERATRVAWESALLLVRYAVRGIEVVGGNPLVRVGVVTLTMTLGVQASFVAHPSRYRGAARQISDPTRSIGNASMGRRTTGPSASTGARACTPGHACRPVMVAPTLQDVHRRASIALRPTRVALERSNRTWPRIC